MYLVKLPIKRTQTTPEQLMTVISEIDTKMPIWGG